MFYSYFMAKGGRMIYVLFVLINIVDSTSVDKFYRGFTPFSGKSMIAGVLSSANTRGRLPHLSIGFSLAFNDISISDPLDTSTVLTGSFPTLAFNLEVGLTKGVKFAPMIGGFGSIDIIYRRGILLLTHIARFKEISDNFYFNTFGFRFGFLRDSRITPALSLNYRYSKTSVGFNFGNSSQPDSGYFNPKSQVIFISLSKKFVAIVPYVGVGGEIVSASGEFRNTVHFYREATGLFFGGLQLSLPVLNFNFEGGSGIGGKYYGAGVRLIF